MGPLKRKCNWNFQFCSLVRVPIAFAFPKRNWKRNWTTKELEAGFNSMTLNTYYNNVHVASTTNAICDLLGCAETLDPKQLNQKRLFLLTIRNGMNVLHEAEMDNVSRCRMRNSGKIRNATC